MNSKLLHEADGQRTFALIFDAGDEFLSHLLAFARDQSLGGSRFSAIGACEEVILGYFDWETKDYKRIPIKEQVEVLSLIGDVAVDDVGSQRIHAHVVLGKSDGTAVGGHILEARVRPTLEVMLVEVPAHLRRKHDHETGLALIEI